MGHLSVKHGAPSHPASPERSARADYCYLPLSVFCGRDLLAAKLRRADRDSADGAVEEVARIVARIRTRWPRTRIMLRADSGFAREDLMAWCEANGVDFVFGLARNERLRAGNRKEPAYRQARAPVQELHVGDAPQLEPQAPGRGQGRGDAGEANPRFIVTSLACTAAVPSACPAAQDWGHAAVRLAVATNARASPS
jgi:hypothetical protein